jgi:hypothetical protein
VLLGGRCAQGLASDVLSLRNFRRGRNVETEPMDAKRKERVELGEFIVADPEICHGKPTYKGTRIMVWQALEGLGRGEPVDKLVKAWG